MAQRRVLNYFKLKGDQEDELSEPRPPEPKKNDNSSDDHVGPEYTMTTAKVKSWPNKYFFLEYIRWEGTHRREDQ